MLALVRFHRFPSRQIAHTYRYQERVHRVVGSARERGQSWQPCSLATFSRPRSVRVHSPNSASGYDRSYLTPVRSSSIHPRARLQTDLHSFNLPPTFQSVTPSLSLSLSPFAYHRCTSIDKINISSETVLSFCTYFRVHIGEPFKDTFAVSRILGYHNERSEFRR